MQVVSVALCLPAAAVYAQAAGSAAGQLGAGPSDAEQLPNYVIVPLPATSADFFASDFSNQYWTWQLLPDTILYHSYLAGIKEPRMGTVYSHDDRQGWVWDSTLGGRVGFLRFGNQDPLYPQGWQLDFEGAVYLRQDPQEMLDVTAADFRAGVPLTYAQGPFQAKVAFYHISSHVGDEYQLKNPLFRRINYKRDAVVFGLGYYVIDSVRVYGEAGWAFGTDGGAEPWEFQFGAEYSPRQPNGFYGAPFLAANAHLREEFNFGGELNAQAGWQWRSQHTGRLLRIGFQYFNGPSPLYEFFDRREKLLGGGLWYDF